SSIGIYLVGVIAGLFERLFIESKLEKGILDYGLSTSRLLASILFSGLGAVGGVLVVMALLLTARHFNGTSIAAALTSAPSLADVYNLDLYPISLIIAAVFGLLPGLLINALHKQAERYLGDIHSSEAAH